MNDIESKWKLFFEKGERNIENNSRETENSKKIFDKDNCLLLNANQTDP